MSGLLFSFTANATGTGRTLGGSVVSMALHYQVISEFSLSRGKPSLVSISIFSTRAACTSLPFWPYPNTYLTISHIFPTLQLAHSYIAYLQGVYPHSPIPPPVLDSGQKELFPEASE